jgi:hypothetical protein
MGGARYSSKRKRDAKLGIDWRQRHAAAHLLMAFDLPAEMHAASEAMIEAADVAYGLKANQVSMIEAGNRLANLEQARDLIDDLIDELRT